MTPPAAAPPYAPERSRRRPVASVRARMLAWVILTAAAGIGLAGSFWYVVQVDRVDVRIRAALVQELDEFRQLAIDGLDPSTGEPFATVDRLFEVADQRNVPDLRQTFLTMVNGEVTSTPDNDEQVHLEDSPELVRRLAAMPTEEVEQGTVTAAGHEIVYAAVPVTIDGSSDVGVYVVGYNRDGERAEVVDGLRTFAAVATASLMLVAVVGWLVAGRLLAPIRMLRRTAQEISDTDLTDRIVVRGHDDVSDLGRTFNAMLDRLQTAFETQRNFLDDAGHELRTPLTIVRGHLELLDPTDPDDARETRELVLDELDRMQRLVDELILLAKSRRPDFVAVAPLAVDELVTDVFEKAAALGDRDWRLDEVEPVELIGDHQRLTQALLQLAANAVKFSGPGTVVALGARSDGALVRMWVRDTGPGIADRDQQRIFERFERAAAGRAVEGSGLGLAIVSAIATAHGGRVVLDSELGRGSTFTLELPLLGPDHPVAASS